MNVVLSFSMAAAPALVLVWYYYRQDRRKPEPKGLILKVFFLGIASTVPAVFLELVLKQFEVYMKGIPFLVAFFRAFFIAALCEEWIKLQVVKRFVYKTGAFDEVMDGVVYTVIASLGFACMENILYVMQYDMTVAVVRAFSAVPMHAFVSGIMGYYIGRARYAENTRREKSLMRKGLFIAVLIHGIYDFILFSMPEMAMVSAPVGSVQGYTIFPLVIILFFVLKRMIKSAIADDVKEGRVVP